MTGGGATRVTAADKAPPQAGKVPPVIAILRADIAAKPSRVLIAVEDALTMNEQAACEIVKEAISATRADPKLTGEIVLTALQCAPVMAAVIVECAVEKAPEARAEIKAAVTQALGEKGGSVTSSANVAAPAVAEESSGKTAAGKETAGTGKEVEEEDAGEDFFGGFLGVGGIYLITPGPGWNYFCDPRPNCCNAELTPSCLQP